MTAFPGSVKGAPADASRPAGHGGAGPPDVHRRPSFTQHGAYSVFSNSRCTPFAGQSVALRKRTLSDGRKAGFVQPREAEDNHTAPLGGPFPGRIRPIPSVGSRTMDAESGLGQDELVPVKVSLPDKLISQSVDLRANVRRGRAS